MEFLTDEQKNRLNEFAKFVVKELGIKNPPKIVIQSTRKGLKTTANYDYTKEDKVMRVLGKGRMIVDISRSIGHELTHHKQWEDGKLEIQPPDIGGPIEDEANAKAGQFIKMFAKHDPTIYDE